MEINWAFFQTAPWWQIFLVVVCTALFVGMLVFGLWMLYKFATYKVDMEWWKHIDGEPPKEDA